MKNKTNETRIPNEMKNKRKHKEITAEMSLVTS